MPADRKRKRILIAEEEKAYSRPLVLKLQNAGFEVESVQNGEEALVAIEQGNFDLLLCDLIMPKMDGFAVLEKVKERGLGPPVVVLSNLSQTDDEKKARALGAIGFVVKSNISIADVVDKVNQFLGVSK